MRKQEKRINFRTTTQRIRQLHNEEQKKIAQGVGKLPGDDAVLGDISTAS